MLTMGSLTNLSFSTLGIMPMTVKIQREKLQVKYPKIYLLNFLENPRKKF